MNLNTKIERINNPAHGAQRRLIKFRAWDIKNEYMIHELSIAHEGDNIWFSDDQFPDKYIDKEYYEPAEAGYYMLDGFELMQFTGLKDRNGTEIYEGDLLLQRECICRGDGMWDDAIVQVVWDYEYNAWFTKDVEGYDAINDFLGDDESEWEVLGNIFQNKQLLV